MKAFSTIAVAATAICYGISGGETQAAPPAAAPPVTAFLPFFGPALSSLFMPPPPTGYPNRPAVSSPGYQPVNGNYYPTPMQTPCICPSTVSPAMGVPAYQSPVRYYPSLPSTMPVSYPVYQPTQGSPIYTAPSSYTIPNSGYGPAVLPAPVYYLPGANGLGGVSQPVIPAGYSAPLSGGTGGTQSQPALASPFYP